MGINITTNLAAIRALRDLEKNSQNLDRSMEKLASGVQINSPGDNPSGFAIAHGLESKLRSADQARRNAQDARSMVQVAEGGLNEVNNLLMRMRELAVLGASDTLNGTARDAIQTEAEELRNEINRIAATSRYLGTDLLNGQGRDLEFLIGQENNEHSRIGYSAGAIDVRSESLGIDELDVSDSDMAFESIEPIDNAINQVVLARAKTGAFQTRLDSIDNQLSMYQERYTSDIARIRDTDYAKETTEFVRHSVSQRAAVAVLMQANSLPSVALKLIDFK